MTRGEQVLAQLVLAEVRAGRLTIQGDRFIRNGVAVRPVLAFERDGAPAQSTAAAAIRRSAGESEVAYETQFAELPESRLVPSNEIAKSRARRAEQRHSPAELIPPRREAAQPCAAATERFDQNRSLNTQLTFRPGLLA